MSFDLLHVCLTGMINHKCVQQTEILFLENSVQIQTAQSEK